MHVNIRAKNNLQVPMQVKYQSNFNNNLLLIANVIAIMF